MSSSPHTAASAIPLISQHTVVVLLLLAALVSGLVFYGTAVNLAVLAVVAGLLLGALLTTGPLTLGAMFTREHSACWVALAILGYLVVAYHLSLSPDNSFAPSWVLAAGPLAFLATSAVVGVPTARSWLVGGVFGLVLLLGIVSSVGFVLYGIRAREPLADANGYAALTYLVWIPFVHSDLVRAWGSATRVTQQWLAVGASFVLLLALLATHSRTATLVVVVSFLWWAALILMRRLAWRPLILHLCAAAAAGMVWLLKTASGVATAGLNVDGGLSSRLELLHSAFAMLAQHPLGVGVFCFPLLYPTFRSPLEQETAGLFVHNDYVQFLVEGGLPLFVLLLVFVVAVLRRVMAGAHAAPGTAAFDRLGIALALAAISAHALVNFVFYSLPLIILIGMLAALLFMPPDDDLPVGVSQDRTRNGMVVAGLAIGWVMWLYLLLDVAIVGVFQDQPGAPFAATIRTDETKMLRFARFAQTLNGNRGIPALGEAVLLYKAARREPESTYLRERTYGAFRHALMVDPWNSLAYLRLAQFLDEFPPRDGRSPGESDEELLQASIGLDPTFVPGIDGLLVLYAANGDDARRYALLRNLVFPWLPTIRKRDAAASERYLDLLDSYAAANGDTEFARELKQTRATLTHFTPVKRAHWFF